MGTPRHQILSRCLTAAMVLLGSFAILGTRPAAAAVPAARVQAFGLPAFADLNTAARPVVAITATTTGGGYWLTGNDGGVFTYGDATFFGSAGALALHKPVVGMAATPTGAGYWLVAADGGIFAYGDALFHGSPGATPLHQPIVGMAPTPTGAGYWLVGADGGIFAYGDATYLGSRGGLPLARAIVGMAPTTSGTGYWLVAGDGGVFAYGDATSAGSLPGISATATDVVGLARSTGGLGYVIARRSGGVYAFGDAPFRGAANLAAERAIVGIAVAGNGYWLADVDAPAPPPPPPPPPPVGVGPPLPAGSGSGRRIVYCNPCQRVWLVEANGVASRSYPVSGRVATPRVGTYSVFSKSRYTSAGHDGITMEYMVRFAQGRSLAIGFHTIPKRADGSPLQTVSQLGTFRSAGCVRQNPPDAIALWNFAPVGTKVVVT